mmetsp:Transcript_26981/g.58994  ORF Transcript_26981/g.58994 Transcript_26981/m.58994 type:complete len:341 (+) Transcript_26981:274-1296(+)|eukprot:CAMPEP_0202889880 /NCGR_PEP_ID=MMETSP1392-20130828/427_1 /ASSEMBLY_ACC=CAM_ASM_000868 /TAXON_ID=225041 /ORGANISM="Chlamydomonas chlamydogama, Strain SAG 11-48b" /LENGTH=340 /DNA_ID=CAMNT_0049573311 /DNA_START=250 /DNA_END=1272 /DNA_ORIENTATION=+
MSNDNKDTSAQRVIDDNASPGASPRLYRNPHAPVDQLDKLLVKNRKWAAARKIEDPDYFERLCAQQNPQYLWIGCADSRVPANVILGLDPGEVFVQRNVGNQATHTDLNVMSCLEYAVKELKVKVVICCGHYGCGAVKAALQLPSKTQGLVNCWISDIRECRNQHRDELRALSSSEQVDRLCELNVMRQTFHVCTSPVVQSAWDQGQQVAVYGVVYSLKDGLIKKLVGPISADSEITHSLEAFEEAVDKFRVGGPGALSAGAISRMSELGVYIEENGVASPPAPGGSPSKNSNGGSAGGADPQGDQMETLVNTMTMMNKLAQHVSWSGAPPAQNGAAAKV